ncbi:MAG: hypothetical protein KJ971_01725 [Firmicutes bacterium]|nr:hypothetical protein [Bacillota bacterium]
MKKTLVKIKIEMKQNLDKLQFKSLLKFVSDCVFHVLYLYEENYPNDVRPRKALEATELFIKNELKIKEARNLSFSAHKAAREASIAAARYVARAAGHAVATIHVKGHAVYALSYALTAVSDDEIKLKQEELWQEKCLFELSQQ